MRRIFLPLALVPLAGCPPGSEKPEDTQDTDVIIDDSGVQYDVGCITVDGAGGYAHVNDAITVATEGAVLQLCAGTYEEAVIVDKGVTLLGGEGVIISGPGADVPLTITGAGATVESVDLVSARTAVILDGSVDATLRDVSIESQSWGVSATGATGTLVEDSAFNQPEGGGIEIVGGDASISGCTFDNPGAFGVHASDGAVVALAGSTINGTRAIANDGSDGFAVYTEGASLAMTGNTLANIDLVGVIAITGTALSLDGDVFDSVPYGVYAADTPLTATGLTMTNSAVVGIYAAHPTGAIEVTDTSITIEAGASCSDTYDDWSGFCGGALLAAPTVTVAGLDVSGYENYGLVIGSYDGETDAVIDVSDVTLSDLGRWGLRVVTASGTIDGLTVSGVREPEGTDELCYYVDRAAAVLLAYTDLAISNTTVIDNVGWGVANYGASAGVDTSTFSGNGCAGIINFDASLSVTGSTFSSSSQYGGIWDYQGVTVAEGNTWTGNHDVVTDRYEYYNDGVTSYEYESTYDYSLDIQAYQSASLVITGNTFVDGNQSLAVYEAEAEVTDNTWTDYDDTIFYAYGGSTSAPPLFARNTAEDVAGYVVYSVYGALEAEDITVGTTRGSTSSYTYYQNGVVTSSYTSTWYSPAFYAYGYYYESGADIYSYPASLSLSNVDVTAALGGGVYAYDATLDLEDLTITSSGSTGIYGSWSGFPAEIEAENIVLDSVTGTAVSLTNSNTTDGYVSISGLTVNTGTSTGVALSGLVSADVSDATFGTLGGSGLTSVSTVYKYDSVSGTSSTIDQATALTLSNLSFVSVAGAGLSIDGGSLAANGITVTTSTGNGLDAEGLTSLVVTTSTFGSAGGYGVYVHDTVNYYDYGTSAYLDADRDTVSILSGVTVGPAVEEVVSFTGGSATIAGVTATGGTADGLYLEGTAYDAQGNTLTGNSGYGMVCSSAVLSACGTNDLSGNGMGTHLGCDDTCGI